MSIEARDPCRVVVLHQVYMNNVEFARHLSLHLESDRAEAVDLADLCQCKYCFKVRS